MNEITLFKNAGLPAVASLSTALRSIQTSTGTGGVPILKLDKSGHWVYGPAEDQAEVEPEATWAVNPFSFVHGFIAWGEREVLSEKMVGVSEPLPELEAAPAGAKKGWETQVGMSLKCLSGEDKGLEVRYSATSTGGKRAVQELAVAIAEQVEKDQTKPIPIVLLKKGHYIHKQYGKIFTPTLEVLDWMAMDAAVEDEPEVVVVAVSPEAALAATAAPMRRRRVA